MQSIKILNPSTLIVNPAQNATVKIYSDKKGIYFFRHIKSLPVIKINMPTPGNYFIENGKVIKTVPIEINKLQAHLPPPDRNRLKHYTIVFNPELTGSPARNFTGKGLIETGTKFKTYPAQLRLFILLHEMAHFWYKAESDCDLWAAIHFIGMGYNNSTALYALTKVLGVTDSNRKRILLLFKNLKK